VKQISQEYKSKLPALNNIGLDYIWIKISIFLQTLDSLLNDLDG